MNADICTRRDRLTRWALGVLLVVFVIWQANHLKGFSWGYDEGVYLMMARLVRLGYAPYTEVYITQGPVFIYSLVAAFHLLGTTTVAGRLVTISYAIIGLLAVALTARELGGELSGLSAVVLLILAPEFFRLSRAAMPDVPTLSMATLAVMSTLCYLRSGCRAWLILAGLGLGIGLLFKLSIAPTILLVELALLCFQARGPKLRSLKSWPSFICDTVLVLGAAILAGIICLLTFDWQAFYEQYIATSIIQPRGTYPLNIASNAHWIGKYLLDNIGLLLLAIGGILTLMGRRSIGGVIVIAWSAIMLLSLVFHTPLFFHHMSILLFPMAILGGCAVGDLGERLCRLRLPTTWRRNITLCIALGVVVGYLFSFPATLQEYETLLAAPTLGTQADVTQFVSTITWPDDWVITDDQAVAFEASRNVPPPLTETSMVRLSAALLTDRQLITVTEDYQPQAVASLSGRFALAPRYLDWVRKHYRLVKSYNEEAQIYYLWRYTSPPPIQHPRQVTLGQWIHFLGYDLHHSPFKPGGEVYLTLYWQAIDRIEEDYTVFTHLLDSEGRLRAQKDNPPVNGFLPTSAWEAGEIIQDRYIIPLDPDIPLGEYQLEIGMYQLETGQRLELNGGPEGEGDRILLGKVEVLD